MTLPEIYVIPVNHSGLANSESLTEMVKTLKQFRRSFDNKAAPKLGAPNLLSVVDMTLSIEESNSTIFNLIIMTEAKDVSFFSCGGL